MAKSVSSNVLDAALDYIIANGITMYACSGEPANYDGIAAVALADVALTGDDYTKASNGDGGRKVTIAEKTGVTIDASGTATHIALAKTTATTQLIYVTTCTSLYLTAAQTMTFGTWYIELRKPT